MGKQRINVAVLMGVILVGACIFGAGWWRLHIDTDVVSSLPKNDSLISDALYIFKHHPMQDQVTVDVEMRGGDLDLLVRCGKEMGRMMAASPLFAQVGLAEYQSGLPLLANHIVSHLPFLFSQKDLEAGVAPLLESDRLARIMAGHHSRLLSMEGIGQSAFLAKDPLGLKDMIMAGMIHLAPTQAVQFHKGELISRDGRHLLLVATPSSSGTDTAFARRLRRFFQQSADEINGAYGSEGIEVILTPMGAYRAALDNEEMVRADVGNAITYATLGIILLLLLAFPRPLLGLFSLLPALTGAAIAFFVYSLIHKSISIMVLGFGGAVISITVDHGIAYLLFLDRPQATVGREASREVWSVGLLATLTTVGAFGALTFSTFPIFQQLGLFTALGISFSFLTVHLVFPHIFPTLPAAARRRLPLPKLVNHMFSAGLSGALAALLLFLFLSFWSHPRFDVNLSAMNSVTPETRAAEKKMTMVWGDMLSKILIMSEAPAPAQLQAQSDSLLDRMAGDPTADLTRSVFLPSMVFPGTARQTSNAAAWHKFWSPERVAELKADLAAESAKWGFSPSAFDPFLALIERPQMVEKMPSAIPPELFPILGIVPGEAHTPWRQVSTFRLPDRYEPQQFYQRYHEMVRIFDPGLFSDRLGNLLFETFLTLMITIACAVTVLLFFLFLDLRLTFISLLPLIFALVCTLGSLKLMGRTLDIPSLMLAIVVLGMGIDYALFLVRAYQRYGASNHPHFNLIRLTVVMASASTLIGFGVLVFARHTLLQSAGITSFLGIGFSLMGAILILPPFLENYFTPPPPAMRAGLDIRTRVRLRYSIMDAYVRMFARFKLRLDPMFEELETLLVFERAPARVMDVGCGYGVPANWLVEKYSDCTVFGIEPDAERVHIAQRALDGRGKMVVGKAPDLPDGPQDLDAVFMLDMLHYLSDADFRSTLAQVKEKLAAHGQLIVRAGLVSKRKWPWFFWLEKLRVRLSGRIAHFRDQDRIAQLIEDAGFTPQTISPSGNLGEMVWVIAVKQKE